MRNDNEVFFLFKMINLGYSLLNIESSPMDVPAGLEKAEEYVVLIGIQTVLLQKVCGSFHRKISQGRARDLAFSFVVSRGRVISWDRKCKITILIYKILFYPRL